MKLHLNLTLRRALMAAMALVTLHTAEAEITTNKGHLYITGEEAPTTAEWAQAWGTTTGNLSVGTSESTGSLTLNAGTYTTPSSIFIAGKGYDSAATVANNGTITVNKDATLATTSQLNIGNSLIGGVGTLAINGGTVSANSIYAGVNLGSSVLTAENGATIIVNTSTDGAVFAMGHRVGKNLKDTATLTNSSITVGIEGGDLDYTSIGHSSGTAELNLIGSTATFADQIFVGEKAGSNGSIHVHDDSTLKLGKTTVLGHETGAKGFICIDGGSVDAQNISIGNSGNGTLDIASGTLTAANITAGVAAGSTGSINNAGTISTQLLTIGEAGSAAISNAGSIASTDIVIGNTEGSNGTLESTGTITTDKLYIGYKGTGSATVDGGSLTAKDAYVNGIGSTLITDGGTTNLTNATALAGSIITGEAGKMNIAGKLIVDDNGSLLNGGSTTVNEAIVNSLIETTGTLDISSLANNASVYVQENGTLSTANTVNKGSIENNGIWNTGKTTSTVGTICNNGTANVTSTLTSGIVTGAEGTINVTKGASWTLTDKATQGTVANNGDITLMLNGRLTASELSGIGTTTILLNSSTTNTADGEAMISLGSTTTSPIKVELDMSSPTAIVGKKVDFLMVDNTLTGLSNDSIILTGNTDSWTADWANSCYTLSTGKDTNLKLEFTKSDNSTDSATSGMFFTKLSESTIEKVTIPGTAQIEIEVVTETTATSEETLKETDVIDSVAQENVTETDKVQTSTITDKVDKNGEKETVNVIFGKNVVSEGTGTTIKTVNVNQKTTDKDGNESHDTIATSGLTMVFEGTSSHTGNGKDKSQLGFNEKVDEQGNKQELGQVVIDGINTLLKEVDIIEVKESSNVTLSDMQMHSTHALTVAKGSTVVFENVDLHVGGTKDTNIVKTLDVIKYDENGNTIDANGDGRPDTEKISVETETHLTTQTVIDNASIKLLGTTTLKFQEIAFDEEIGVDPDLHGTTVIKDSELETSQDTTLGSTDTGMQEIVLENTNVKGSGKMKNTKMKGGDLTVGSSPGTRTIEQVTAEDLGNLNFYMITNAAWDTTGCNGDDASELTYGTGCISQLVVADTSTLTGVGSVNIIFQKLDENGNYVLSTSDEVDALGQTFQEGMTIKFIDGIENLSYTGAELAESALPTLNAEEGLFWDTSALFTEGIVTVIGEVLEEPTRIANTLVSAGETVLNFGRLAGAQANLREAGTTRTWGSAISVFDSIDSGNTTNGYDYNAWGAAVGVDHAFTKNTVVGAAFGCTWGENEAEFGTDYYSAGSIDQDAKMVGIYGTHKFQTKGLMNDVKLSAFAAYGWFENDSTRQGIRNGSTATAEWDSDAWVLSASLSRDITTDGGVVFTPYVGVEYTKAGMDDFTETGKNSTADYTATEDYSNLAVKVGMTVSATFGGFTPYAGIAYIGDVDRSAAKVSATGRRDTLTGESALPGRDALQLKVGANWQLTETLDLNAGYTAELREKATEQSANVGIGLTF